MKLSVDVSVTELAEAWTTQVGYPLVSVSIAKNGSFFTLEGQVGAQFSFHAAEAVQTLARIRYIRENLFKNDTGV